MPDRSSASGAGAAAGRGWSTSTAQGDVRQPRILTPFVDSGNYLGGAASAKDGPTTRGRDEAGLRRVPAAPRRCVILSDFAGGT
jgi:hypothetical protein